LINLPKKVSELNRKEILKSFLEGVNIKEISSIYNFSITTITRQLKKSLGESKFNEVKNIAPIDRIKKEDRISSQIINSDLNNQNSDKTSNLSQPHEDFCNFVELEPVAEGIEFEHQKEVSSKPLKSIEFPEVVYIVVDKEIELSPKLLNEYPEWSFLPALDLNRYTIEIFSAQKDAKNKCNKNQKILKVPNPKVFLIASGHLKNKGITRLIFGDLLISI